MGEHSFYAVGTPDGARRVTRYTDSHLICGKVDAVTHYKTTETKRVTQQEFNGRLTELAACAG